MPFSIKQTSPEHLNIPKDEKDKRAKTNSQSIHFVNCLTVSIQLEKVSINHVIKYSMMSARFKNLNLSSNKSSPHLYWVGKIDD